MSEDKELKLQLSPTVQAYCLSNAVVNVICSPLGEGKCVKSDTYVIMFSGELKKAGDIIPGDQLMGDDSTPRNVLSVTTGTDEMYEIIPVKGEPFTCNKEHILVLDGMNLDTPKEEICIAVKDYIKKPKYFQSSCKLIRKGIDFPAQNIEIDPYFIGLWLADGRNDRICINVADGEIVNYLNSFAKLWSTGITVIHERSKANSYHLTSGNVGHDHKIPIPETLLLRTFKKLNLFNNKHIPDVYKYNSRGVRLGLLAGLIDGDGFFNHEGYDYLTKYKQLADDVVYLCRSLNLAAYAQKCTKGIKSTGFTGEYYRIHISGDCSAVPVLLDRRKCKPRKQIKRVTVTGIKEVKSLGRGEYCGFVLDGNHKFLLGSFIVSHNTVGSIAAMLVHAKRCGRPIRCAIVRDTHENIKISTARSVEDILPPHAYKFRNDFKELKIFSEPTVQCDLFGIDDLASLSKLQGPEYALIWLEEPAPMADKCNAGLPEEVFNAALVRCARQSKTVPRLQVSMNPADQDHWTYRRLFEVDVLDPENPLITKAVFQIPYGENKFLPDIARQAARTAYRHDEASFKRYVEGKFVPVQTGSAVTPNYNSGAYTSENPLEPCEGLEGFRGWDGWHMPSALIGQITTTGRLVFIDTVVGHNCDVGILARQKVLPLLNSPRWKGKCKSWRDIGDVSMKTPDQSDITKSAARVIEDIFGTFFEGGPARWVHMKMGVDNAFATNIAGKPSFVVNKANRLLDKALSGSWHFKTDNSGNIIGDVPDKNNFSHIGDAWANVINVLLPMKNRKSNRVVMQKLRRQARKRATSYSVGG